MLKRICWQLLFTCLVIGTSWAADNPFVGKWRLNPSRSKLSDEMKVERLSGNKYAFDFGSGHPETVVADGTDQSADFATTLAVTIEAPNKWKVVRKKEASPSSQRPGSFPKTAIRSPTTLRAPRPKGQSLAWTTCMNGLLEPQVLQAHGKAIACK
jgi:hypothetical protein